MKLLATIFFVAFATQSLFADVTLLPNLSLSYSRAWAKRSVYASQDPGEEKLDEELGSNASSADVTLHGPNGVKTDVTATADAFDGLLSYCSSGVDTFRDLSGTGHDGQYNPTADRGDGYALQVSKWECDGDPVTYQFQLNLSTKKKSVDGNYLYFELHHMCYGEVRAGDYTFWWRTHLNGVDWTLSEGGTQIDSGFSFYALVGDEYVVNKSVTVTDNDPPSMIDVRSETHHETHDLVNGLDWPAAYDAVTTAGVFLID